MVDMRAKGRDVDMPKKRAKTPVEKLLKAYDRALLEIKEDLSEKSLKQAIEDAKQAAHDLGDLTHEEIEAVFNFIMRDIHNAGEFLHQTGKGLSDWLHFDLMLIEDKIWEMFLIVADKSQIDWMDLDQWLKRGGEYHSKEIIGIGTLQCTGCGHLIHFKKTSHIPKCRKCHGTVFIRAKK